MNPNLIEKYIGFANTTQVQKTTILDTLKKVVEKGDPVFIMDFFQGKTNIVKVATKSSLLITSLETEGTSCLYEGEMPIISKRSSAFKKIRWWFFPILFMLACWALLICPEEFEKHYFQKSIFDPKWFQKNQVKKYLPIIPVDLS